MEELKKEMKDAISTNNVEELQRVVNKVCNENLLTSTEEVKEVLGESLYHAAILGRYEIVKDLVKNGADVNYEDPLKQSVLLKTVMSEASEESDEILKFLLENGSNINHRSINGQSDFMFLMASNRLSYLFLTRFIDSLCEIKETDLRTGGSYLHLIFNRPDDENKILILRKLLDKGLEVSGKDNNDDTPLHLMAAIADCESMRFLVENGADIQARNRLGETVLHTLASSNEFDGFQDSLNFLMEMGLDINQTDSNGKTAIHHALVSKDTDEKAIEEFIKRGIRINVKDSCGRTELYDAIEEVDTQYSPSDLERRAAVIRLLANAGVDVNEGDMYGITPLHLATTRDDLEILVSLLDAGADVTKKTKSGATVLHWSCKIYNMAHVIIHCYLSEGYDINVVDKYGSTALHWAVWFRMSSVSQSLLQVGSDYTIKDNSGNTPLDLAKKLLFTKFLDLVANDKYKHLEGLSLQDPVIECDSSDPLHACPLLHYIPKEEGKLCVDEYIEHLKMHDASLVKCIKTSLDIENMGLFYDIEENSSVPEVMDNLMQCLNERVGERNPLFRCKLRLSGSVYERTKVSLPNEFDYLWIFKEFCKTFSPVESPAFPESFVKLKLRSAVDEPRFRRYLTKENFLDSRLLIRDFHRTVNEELMCLLKDENRGQFSNIVCLKLLNEISCSNSSLSFQFFGKEAKFFRISIDVVPTILFEDWKPREFKAVDLGAPAIAGQHPCSFHVIMKTPDRCHVKEFSTFFRISYAYLEQCIMREVPKVMKKGYILLKILGESGYLPKVVDHDNNGTVKQYITSYHLKTCFLHEVDSWRHGADGEEGLKELTVSDDNNSVTLTWARRIVYRYEKSVQERFLATFFEPKRNLLGLQGKEDVMTEGDIFLGMVNLLKYLINVVDRSS